MSEPDPVPADQNDRLLCACGAEIGKLISIHDGAQLLQAGALLIREGHSMFCIHCGRQVHWSVSDRREERRIKQELKARASRA